MEQLLVQQQEAVQGLVLGLVQARERELTLRRSSLPTAAWHSTGVRLRLCCRTAVRGRWAAPLMTLGASCGCWLLLLDTY